MVNSNVPHLCCLFSVSCVEIIVEILILSSVRSNKHDGFVVSVVRTERLQTRSLELPQKKKSTTYHISEPIIGRFCPNLVLVRSLRSSFIDSFSSAKKRYNISQGFGAFFGQACDRDRFLFPFISEFLFFSLC